MVFSICGFEQSKQSSLPVFQATHHTKTSCQNSAISVELAGTSLNFTEGGTFFFLSQTIDHIPASELGQKKFLGTLFPFAKGKGF